MLAFGTVAILTGAAFYSVFSQAEYGAVDDSLRTQAANVGSSLDDNNGHVRFAAADALPGETSGGIAVTALLVDTSGTIVDRSAPRTGEPGDQALIRLAQKVAPVTGTAHFTESLDGHPARVMAQALDAGNGGRVVLVLARPISELRGTIDRVASSLVGSVALLIFGAAFLGHWLAGRALRPVRQLSATAAEISRRDLSRRISLDLPPHDEIAELGTTFNAMLERLETSFLGLQRFTADAAHELRAPLALMRSEVEVSLRQPRSAAESVATQQRLLGEIDRLSRLADRLLLLARADAGELLPRRKAVGADAVVETAVERWRIHSRAAGVGISWESDQGPPMQVDTDLVTRLLDNLIDNAVRHSPEGGEVRVEARRGTDVRLPAWVITVSDDGPGVPLPLQASLFERFTRTDEARTRDAGGAGLGLSLCAAIARAHGGHIAMVPSDRGARFECILPDNPADPATDSPPG